MPPGIENRQAFSDAKKAVQTGVLGTGESQDQRTGQPVLQNLQWVFKPPLFRPAYRRQTGKE